MPKRHTDATKLSAIVLVKHAGASVDDAAATLGVTPKAVREWIAADVPGDAWGDLERLFLAKAADRGGRDDTRGLPQLLTAAGIAARNVRYGQLIARREARKAEEAKAAEPEAMTPEQKAIAALPDDRRRWLASYCFTALEAIDRHGERDGNGTTSPEELDAALGRVTGMLGRTVEERTALYSKLATCSEADLDAMEDEAWSKAVLLVQEWRVYREQRDGQWWYTVTRPDGTIYDAGSNRCPRPFHLLPILDGGPEPNAVQVNNLIEEAEHFLLETTA